MTTHICTSPARAAVSLPQTASPRVSLVGLLGLWRSRKALANLTPEQLADVGISAHAAAAEAKRPVWDVPAHWLD